MRRSNIDRREPFSATLRILNKYDPEGLLAIGAPIYEYEHEASDIALLLRNSGNVTGEALAIYWEKEFGPNSAYLDSASKKEISIFAAEISAVSIVDSGG